MAKKKPKTEEQARKDEIRRLKRKVQIIKTIRMLGTVFLISSVRSAKDTAMVGRVNGILDEWEASLE